MRSCLVQLNTHGTRNVPAVRKRGRGSVQESQRRSAPCVTSCGMQPTTGPLQPVKLAGAGWSQWAATASRLILGALA